ncbi:MAG: hypothetical protein A2898_03140 [Candidatus Kerfeldbacteria bacterium RIFCSPLOWO2_01_FULL_48_11]|uniref:Peptidase M24 domain-containing protein n=1 Tax=Candidatus Kerfeldbacteria bacterium RIFCSPLOWO2_01_FULL_48_11 TaxID=1798543 RepID=A0A1G2B6R0_9BACT|nr:MAG: hypothetical protein UY34_C0022G0010 [Parcubacteria group bacterium GW2011_GWA2_48_9]KKW15581.1 MAG: hypothetical protein UY52_C0017G0004 [Parcubacteria group bacterium GW2011_GWC2_49_9]OGY84898.1 MAG: hypothetical protein A2898_03140 [Candidatus Kerfeldbacteria bacterium RIFCSPLOWO2_01_FULL_48_11]HCJ52352.1 hypothetical protein [Candidatus Kerfeldbacteria bacterium]HCM68213.1 hypothetical protein [Candidatus Kerfeldbacteria bacterium]
MTQLQLRAIRKALSVCGAAYHKLHQTIQPGMSEYEIRRLVEEFMRSQGYRRMAFPTIVAVGPNAYDFHHQPRPRRICRGDMVVIDFGVRTANTCTDITRTFFMGPPTTMFRHRYRIVLEAQKRALDAIAPEVQCSEVDMAARSYFRTVKLGRAFRHGTGHGVGFRIHQFPRINARSSARLSTGMVVTIEPGVYLRGWGGIRIEDMVEIRPGRSLILSHGIPKNLNAMIIHA